MAQQPAGALDVGRVVAGRTVLSPLGSGATSTVVRVVDPAGRVEALKVLDADAPDELRTRFRREFRAAARLDHPSVVAVHELGQLDGALWMTQQCVDGGTARELVPSLRGLPDLPRVLRVLGQVAAGLDHAHGRGVLHLDVAPGNVLLPADATAPAVLTDFGLAQLADEPAPPAPRRVRGTVAYLAPELVLAHPATAATDQYGLACVAVELLTGLPPFPFATPFAVAHGHARSLPPRVSARRGWLPSAADSILAKALAKDPQHRYRTCAEPVALLVRALRSSTPRRGRR